MSTDKQQPDKPESEEPKIPLWRKILLIILIVVVLVESVFAGVVLYRLKKAENPDGQTEAGDKSDTGEPSQTEAVEMDPEDVQWAPDADGNAVGGSDQNIVNIMLIGQDKREGEDRQRSDSMILITINKADQTLKMTSFMRDLYVQIPGHDDNRMNAAY